MMATLFVCFHVPHAASQVVEMLCCASLLSCFTGETEETAATVAKEVVDACQAVYSSVSCLLDDIDMPSSNVWLWPRS